jgi:hypothetical protein
MQASPAVTAAVAPCPVPVPEERTPVFQVLLGLFPCLMLGLLIVLSLAPVPADQRDVPGILSLILFIIGSLACLAGLLVGWLRGFPAWSLPYLAFVLLYSAILSGASTPGLVIFNVPIWGGGLWSWRAFVPAGIVALLGLLLSRPPWRPLARLAQGIWQDWTGLAFGLYTPLPFGVLIFMDEIENGFRFWVSLPALIVIVVGGFLYLRFPARRLRFLWLPGSAFLALLVTIMAGNLYWQTHDINFTTGQYRLVNVPLRLDAALGPALGIAGGVALILFTPALIGLAHRLYRRITAPPIKP